MSDSANQIESDAVPNAFAPRGTMAPVAFLHRRAGSVWISLLLALICGGGSAAIILWSERTKTPPSIDWVAALVLLGCIALVLLWNAVVNWWRRRSNRRVDRMMATLAGPEWDASVALSRALHAAGWRTLDTTLPFISRERRWKSLQRLLDSHAHPKPKAIVDWRLSKQCHDIGWTEELLDPESLDSRIAGDGVVFVWRSRVGILVCGVALSSCMALRSGWSGFLLALLLCLIFFTAGAAWPIFRAGIPRLRAAPIAAMGTVIDSRQRRWTSADSILLVEPENQNIIAVLYGPAGRLRLRFHNRDDEGFAALWRHWIHPKPNFDLLTRSA